MSEFLTIPTEFPGVPIPEITGEWKPYWEGTARGEILIQECPACRHRQFYPRVLCTKCGAQPNWLKASGKGTLHTFSVGRQNLTPAFVNRRPYVLAIVDLEEGVRMMSNVVDCPLDEVRIGMPLEAFFVLAHEQLNIHVPFFRPAR